MAIQKKPAYAGLNNQPAKDCSVCVAAPFRVPDFDEGIVKETGFLASTKLTEAVPLPLVKGNRNMSN
ncbi:MAG TPA: hypothetical protein DCY88_14580 [Cyanobacteria bacterium UBA11372]|nr:hypothetical protein [Cyanobacteria bacterium UBA11372]